MSLLDQIKAEIVESNDPAMDAHYVTCQIWAAVAEALNMDLDEIHHQMELVKDDADMWELDA